MTEQRFRVGIVGLQPGRSWATRAHILALRALSESYEIVGVANTSLASAEKAAAEVGLSRAFAMSPNWLRRRRSTSSLSRLGCRITWKS
jgi:predicted dehydrogenase